MYDDGDDEWILLAEEHFKWAGEPRRAALPSRARRAVIDDSDDDDRPAADAAGPAPSGGRPACAAAAAAVVKSRAQPRAPRDSEAHGRNDEDSDVSIPDEDDAAVLHDDDVDMSEDSDSAPKRNKAPAAKARSKSSGRSTVGDTAPLPEAPPPPLQQKSPRSVAPRAAVVATAVAAASAPLPPPLPLPLSPLLLPPLPPLPPPPGVGAAAATLALGGLAHSSEVARFAARAAERFPFLAPGALRDAAGRRPDHPSYDPSTLLLPPTFPRFLTARGEEVTLSGGQEQWWRFKAAHFDCVLLFKMGKARPSGAEQPTQRTGVCACSALTPSTPFLVLQFYEMIEMDAHVGVAVLGCAAREQSSHAL